MHFVLGQPFPQPLESHGWDSEDVGSSVVDIVGVGTLDLYGGFR